MQLKALAILGRPPGASIAALGLNGSETSVDALAMNSIFAGSLHRALCAEGDEEVPWQSVTRSLPPLVREPHMAEIERYAVARWNAILHFMVNSEGAPVPAPKVLELLVSTGLLAPGEGEDGDGNDLDSSNDPDWRPKGKGASSSIEEATALPSSAAAAAKARSRMRFEEVLRDANGVVHMTKGGYEFLLKDTSVQLWTFMHQYLSTAVERDMRAADILAFLFELGFCKLGQGYAIAALTDTQKRVLEEFASFGLVYIPDDQRVHSRGNSDSSSSSSSMVDVSSDGWGTTTASISSSSGNASGSSSTVAATTDTKRFYPTSLAIILTQSETSAIAVADTFQLDKVGGLHSESVAESDAAEKEKQTQGQGQGQGSGAAAGPAPAPTAVQGGSDIHLQMIVEKNFKIYAYTTVDLHIALLALISKIEIRMPNLVIATLTRRAVMKAYEKGLTSGLIIHFLRQRIHPLVTSRGLSVPENVCDQLTLWEQERHRVQFRASVLLDGFDTVAQYTEVAQFAHDAGGLLFAKDKEMVLALLEAAYPKVKEFMRSRGIIAAAPPAAAQ